MASVNYSDSALKVIKNFHALVWNFNKVVFGGIRLIKTLIAFITFVNQSKILPNTIPL